MTAISQKDYLKKYLGIGKAPGEKKKKKKKVVGDRLKIIDDDADVLMSQEIEEDISAANEDAPQIVAVIDERPPSLRIDEQTKRNLWKPIGQSDDGLNVIKSFKLNTGFKLSKKIKSSSSYKPQRSNKRKYDVSRMEIKEVIDSLPKRSRDSYTSSPHIRGSDYSPPRREIKIEEESLKKRSSDEISLLRRKKSDDYKVKRYRDSNSSPGSNNSGKDNSPIQISAIRDSSPQRSKDNSPPRRNRRDGSSSSSRKHDSDYSPPRKRERDQSPLRRNITKDSIPPRKSNSPVSGREKDISPPRRKTNDLSPPRRINRGQDSPPLRKKSKEDYCSPRTRSRNDISPPRRRNRDDTPPKGKNRENARISPPISKHRERGSTSKGKSSRWGDWSPETSPTTPRKTDKMEKTLDGKKSGLQNAKDLVKETTLLRQREDEIFQNMSLEVSGRNAATVVRAKKTQDPEEEARKLEKEKKTKDKYDRWGKGVKQVEDQNERITEQLREMSKPLARYADDEDLEKYLKDQERDGDPMLAYIRKKKKKQAVAAGVPEKPMFMGEFMPNRFGIPPGYRWDGVDRSNGYEKKWFQVQNEKRANQEEAFKWSTEDM